MFQSDVGACLWDLSLGQRTGDGRFDGETFLGGLLIFFLGGRGGEEELQGMTGETFSQDDASSKQPCLCYILYIVYDVYAHAVYVVICLVICYMSITCICLSYVVICSMSVICYMSVICLVLEGVVGLGYILSNAHLCNHMLLQKWWWDLGHRSVHC